MERTLPDAETFSVKYSQGNLFIMLETYQGAQFLTLTQTIKSKLSPIKAKWKNLWKNEEAKFRLATSMKMTMVPIFSFGVTGGCVYILLKMNLLYFRAKEMRGINQFEEVFYDFLSNTLIELLPYAFLLLIFNVVASLYVSDLLLRPFRTIGEYCEKRNSGDNSSYNPDFFTDLKLLSQFSEFFFNTIETAEVNKSLHTIVIPKKYTKIHKPVFETTFFLHYLLYLVVTLLVVSSSLYIFTNELYSGLIDLAKHTLPIGPEVNFFLTEQTKILESIIWIVLFATLIMYSALAKGLYKIVATPAFAIFSTMRSFLKGKYRQRVHLIGYPYFRDQTRNLNKYLDWIEKNLVPNKEKESNNS